MTLQSIFKRKKNYSWLSEESIAHACANIEVKPNGKDDDSTPTDEDDEKDQHNTQEVKPKQKKKSFFRSVKNFILLKKLRSSKVKRKGSSSRETYGKLDEDFGELDDHMYEILRKNDKNGDDTENLEDVMRDGKAKRRKMETSSEERIQRRRKQKEIDKRRSKQGVRIDPKATQFKKRKSAKKKAIKATKRTGKFIGRGALYTGAAFQYLAPVASLPPERTWKSWEARSSREAYRQSEYMFF